MQRPMCRVALAAVLVAACGEPNVAAPPLADHAALLAAETETGLRQSPIDIRDDEVTFRKRLPPIGFRYTPSTELTLVNTGSPDEFATVRADVPTGAAELRIRGVAYSLLQFHWHAPGEHRVNGEEAPMEMHLVHQARDGSLLVVGVLIEAGKPNGALHSIFRGLPAVEDEERQVMSFDLRQLLPRDHPSYRYHGSLTTPPFTEGVDWIVLADPLEMSSEQIAAFVELFPDGNTREPQPLNGRTVVTDKR